MADPDIYWLYENAVQDPEHDLATIEGIYRDVRRTTPQSLREDFAGTFYSSSEWIKRGPKREAIAIDLDPKCLNYGKKTHASSLTEEQRKRLTILRKNVLSKTRKVDLAVALNFSYFIFKERPLLLKYFKNIAGSLKPNGLFFLDVLGGTEMLGPTIDRRKIEVDAKGIKSFTYIWEQENFDPVTNSADFSISFRLRNGKFLKKIFLYPWRLWSLPELRECLADAGFKTSYVYWEGTDRKGEGNGIFKHVEREENCEVWIAYLVASLV